MKIFRLLVSERKNDAWRTAGVAMLFVLLFATAAPGDVIDDSLPSDSPPAVKASARQAIQNGLPQEDVVKLTRAMLQNKFDEQQVQVAHTLMIEAKNRDIPVLPLMNKAFEGMAKNVSPPQIVSAMETVQSRNEFAFQRAAQLTNQRRHTENLGRTLAASLAAGFSKEDADRIMKIVQQRARSMNSNQVYSLSLACFETIRDVSRLGVSSQNVTDMVANALNNGFNHQDLRVMRNTFMTEARHSRPQELARSYSAAIQQNKGLKGGQGTRGGASPGSGASGGNAGGGSGGPGGSGGSGGSGPGGGGSGGSGPGGGGSGGSGPGGGGSGGNQ